MEAKNDNIVLTWEKLEIILGADPQHLGTGPGSWKGRTKKIIYIK